MKDIQPGAAGSIPRHLTAVGSLLYFFANDGTHGQELWKSDGTEAGTVLVKDVQAGPAGQNFILPGRIAVTTDGTLFFRATDGANDGLWKSDGTAAGTVFVAGTSTSPSISQIVAAGSRVYFVDSTARLWQSDGTPAGTAVIDRDIRLDTEMVEANGVLYYVRFDSPRPGLWKVESTGSGPSLVMQAIDTNLSLPQNLTPVGDTLYFSAVGRNTGRELYSHPLGSNSAALVKDVLPGPGSSNPSNLIDVNGTLYFTAVDAAGAHSLWRSMGAESNTTPVAPINSGAPLEPPDTFAALGTRVLFVNDDAATGPALWTSDGTSTGTRLVKDIYPGTDDSNPFFLGRLGDRMFFTAYDGSGGHKPWSTDGTAAGTAPLPGSSSASAWSSINGKGYFAGHDWDAGTEPWVTDGTPAGTFRLGDLNPGVVGSGPSRFTAYNGQVYFAARDNARGTELWKTDGTPAGTTFVKDINPGPDSSAPELLVANGVLYLAATTAASGRELWRSDGTADGTVLVKDIYPGARSSSPTSLTEYNGALYFNATDYFNAIDDDFNGARNNELWKSDGTAAGTVQVKDIAAGNTQASYPHQFVVAGGLLYFAADDRGAAGRELWRTDGTTAGTILVKDIRPGPASSSPSPEAGVGGRLFFFANDGVVGQELWTTRGTDGTTTLVKDTNPGPGGSSFTGRGVASGGRFFFPNGHRTAGAELWSSDGTAAGTALFQDLAPGLAQGVFGRLLDGGDALYFAGSDGVTGFEPYKVADTFAPNAWAAEFDHGGRSRLVFRFNENASSGLTASDPLVTNLDTGERVPAQSIAVSYDPATHAATFTFPGYPGGVLPNGNYRVTLPAGAATDPSGNATAAEASVDFFVLTGDINRDRTVNGSDFALLAGSFGRTGASYEQGDINGDGAVNGSDFALLAANFGKIVPAPHASSLAAASVAPAAPQKTAVPAPRKAAAPARPAPIRRRPAPPRVRQSIAAAPLAAQGDDVRRTI